VYFSMSCVVLSPLTDSVLSISKVILPLITSRSQIWDGTPSINLNHYNMEKYKTEVLIIKQADATNTMELRKVK
jgi:hypothetical protein